MITKTELEARIIEKVQAADGKMTKAACKRVLETVLETIQEGVVQDGGVCITGFGKFEKSRRKERVGRNVHTGEDVPIPAHDTVSFKAGQNFKRAVSGG